MWKWVLRCASAKTKADRKLAELQHEQLIMMCLLESDITAVEIRWWQAPQDKIHSMWTPGLFVWEHCVLAQNTECIEIYFLPSTEHRKFVVKTSFWATQRSKFCAVLCCAACVSVRECAAKEFKASLTAKSPEIPGSNLSGENAVASRSRKSSQTTTVDPSSETELWQRTENFILKNSADPHQLSDPPPLTDPPSRLTPLTWGMTRGARPLRWRSVLVVHLRWMPGISSRLSVIVLLQSVFFWTISLAKR